MRVLACGVVYNEIDILPYLLDHFKSQGIDIFIFDNDSDDGTWEYLLDNKIDCKRLKSDGKFSLVQFIKKMTEKWKEIKPDWCIYLDADEFPLTFQFPTFKELIEDRDKKGFNVINQERVNFRPAGSEDFSLGDPLKIYRYYFHEPPHQHPRVNRVFKFDENVDVISSGGHHVRGIVKKIVSKEPLDNPIFHYTIRENAEKKIRERIERRMRDEETVKLKWNVHYQTFVDDKKWIWNKDELLDIKDPENEFYKIINRRKE